MDATTMRPTKELLSQLKADYPNLTFIVGKDFVWSKSRQELTVDLEAFAADALTLHELGHALLQHESFTYDVELLRHEREAWEYAKTALAPTYGVTIATELIEGSLDTYREWLHIRSLCPHCGLTGMQTKTSTYACMNCRCLWRPNDARRTNLRRYKIT
jgi:hypothetical protein